MSKIGDKVLCKKTFTMSWNRQIYYKKNKWYKLCEGRNKYEFLIISDSYISNFYFDKRKDTTNYLHRYFYSKGELRKMKIKKLGNFLDLLTEKEMVKEKRKQKLKK